MDTGFQSGHISSRKTGETTYNLEVGDSMGLFIDSYLNGDAGITVSPDNAYDINGVNKLVFKLYLVFLNPS